MTLCPYCGSNNVKKNGTKLCSNSVTKQRYFCKDCKHSFFHTSTPIVIDYCTSTHYRMTEQQAPSIATVYMTGAKKSSCTVVVPQALAKKHNLEAGAKVVFKESDKGLLLSRLDIKELTS